MRRAQLVGTLAHPLNRPRYRRASAAASPTGYAILQPRVGDHPARARARRGSRGCSAASPASIPYTRAVSDVYQDLFGEGSFIGKGIYDVDAFEQALGGRVSREPHPQPRSARGRVRALGAGQRRACCSRTIRRATRRCRAGGTAGSAATGRSRAGCCRACPAPSRRAAQPDLARCRAGRSSTTCGAASCRSRSLALLAARLDAAGAGVARGRWSCSRVIVAPALLATLARPRAQADASVPLADAPARASAPARAGSSARSCFALACLPYDACVSVDAIAAHAGARAGHAAASCSSGAPPQRRRSAAGAHGCVAAYSRRCGSRRLAALAIGAAVLLATPTRCGVAVPLLSLWLRRAGAGVVAEPAARGRALASSTPSRRIVPAHGSRAGPGGSSRRYVGAEDNCLPPDNFQEDPPRGVAHRTSPTNIGLALLANLAAYDFGYLAVGELVARTARTLATLEQLERYRGHFYNWYDTRTLEPLRPLYVSTVDSGNLAGHLLTLARGLDELVDAPRRRPSAVRRPRATRSTCSPELARDSPRPCASAATCARARAREHRDAARRQRRSALTCWRRSTRRRGPTSAARRAPTRELDVGARVRRRSAERARRAERLAPWLELPPARERAEHRCTMLDGSRCARSPTRCRRRRAALAARGEQPHS